MTPKTKSAERWAQAAIDAMYEACKDALEGPQGIVPAVDYFKYRLGTAGHSYSVHAWKDTLDEIEQLRRITQKLKPEHLGRIMQDLKAEDEECAVDENDWGPDIGPTVGYCSKCGEAREEFYTCRDGGSTVPKEDAP